MRGSNIARLLMPLLMVLTTSSCTHSPYRRDGKSINLGLIELKYRQYRPSIPGRWLVATNRSPQYSEDRTSHAEVYAIDTDGRASLLKVLKAKDRHRMIMETRKVAKDIYAMVDCEKYEFKCMGTQVRFFDLTRADIMWVPTPGTDVPLNYHDFRMLPNENVLYLFASFNSGTKSIENRIQEWDSKGRIVFDWLMDDHIRDLDRLDLTAHINSIDVDSHGDLIVGIPRSNSILKIDKRTGKVVSQISKPGWKFIDDAFQGFVFQHSVRSLQNGNLLLLDNGDGVNGRPTRAVEYELDFANKTAKLVWEYRIPADDKTFRNVGGSVQRLSNGNTLISWGATEGHEVTSETRLISEVDRERRLVREIKGNLLNYRVWFDELKE